MKKRRIIGILFGMLLALATFAPSAFAWFPPPPRVAVRVLPPPPPPFFVPAVHPRAYYGPPPYHRPARGHWEWRRVWVHGHLEWRRVWVPY